MAVSCIFKCVLFAIICFPEVKSISQEYSTERNISYFTIFHSSELFSLFMDSSHTFNVSYSISCENRSSEYILNLYTHDPSVMTVTGMTSWIITCQDAAAVPILAKNLSNSDYAQTNTPQSVDQLRMLGSITIVLRGELVGKTFIGFHLSEQSSNTTIQEIIFAVSVLRERTFIVTILHVLVFFFVIFVTLTFGCKLDLQVIKDHMKRPIAPVIGLICQYLLMPMIAYGIAKVVSPYSETTALGIFLIGCCPGGGISTMFTHLLDGDLSLSATMTTFSNLAALGMLPLWMYTVGQQFVDAANIKIPFLNMFTTLLTLVIPLCIGIIFTRKLPRVRKVLLKMATPLTIVSITLILGTSVYSYRFIVRLLNLRIALAASSLPYFGYILSGIACLILRQDWKNTKTIVIETGVQNVGIAVLLLFFVFPEPEGDLAAVSIISYGFLNCAELFALSIPYLIYKRCKKERYDEVSTNGGVNSERVNGDLEVKENEMNLLENGKEHRPQEPNVGMI